MMTGKTGADLAAPPIFVRFATVPCARCAGARPALPARRLPAAEREVARPGRARGVDRPAVVTGEGEERVAPHPLRPQRAHHLPHRPVDPPHEGEVPAAVPVGDVREFVEQRLRNLQRRVDRVRRPEDEQSGVARGGRIVVRQVREELLFEQLVDEGAARSCAPGGGGGRRRWPSRLGLPLAVG
eukprot:gene10208-biopygen11518